MSVNSGGPGPPDNSSTLSEVVQACNYAMDIVYNGAFQHDEPNSQAINTAQKRTSEEGARNEEFYKLPKRNDNEQRFTNVPINDISQSSQTNYSNQCNSNLNDKSMFNFFANTGNKNVSNNVNSNFTNPIVNNVSQDSLGYSSLNSVNPNINNLTGNVTMNNVSSNNYNLCDNISSTSVNNNGSNQLSGNTINNGDNPSESNVMNSNIRNSSNLSNSENSTKSPYEFNKNNRYTASDKGPFVLILESCNKNIGKLHKMTIGKLIFTNFNNKKDDIDNIYTAGRNKIKIIISNYKTANYILDDVNFLNTNSVRAYIPESLVYRKGVIKNVDSGLSVEEITDVMKTSINVVNVKRIIRKVINNNEESFINTETLILTFRGQNLPEYVSIYGARCSVLPYIYRVVQCKKCCRFGHHEKQCRSSLRCPNCGEQHFLSDCKNTPICLSCKGEHITTYVKCPEFQKQREIKKFMAYNNISFKEARSKYRNYSSVVKDNFPPLQLSNSFNVLENIVEKDGGSNYSFNNFGSNPYRYTNKEVSQRVPRTLLQNNAEKSSELNHLVINEDDSSNVKISSQRFIRNPYAPQPQLEQHSTSSTSKLFTEQFFNKMCTIILHLLSQSASGYTYNATQIRDLLSSSFDSEYGLHNKN